MSPKEGIVDVLIEVSIKDFKKNKAQTTMGILLPTRYWHQRTF